MAKYLTIELKLPHDTDVYNDKTQADLVKAVETFESVTSARVVGVGEGAEADDRADAHQHLADDAGDESPSV